MRKERKIAKERIWKGRANGDIKKIAQEEKKTIKRKNIAEEKRRKTMIRRTILKFLRKW